MKSLRSKFNISKLNFYPSLFILILVVTIISLGQTTQGYFWIDDNALIYKLQHLNENIGYWGQGMIGGGPYRYIIVQFVPFYPYFKINPFPYFLVGLLIYFIASLTLYIFINSISRNKSIAFWSAMIFATGYVGLESILGITNSWQTSRGIIMALITFWFYYKYLNEKIFAYYILSLVLFFFSLETVFIRSHGLFIALIFLDLLYGNLNFKLKRILFFVFRQTPFIYLNYKIFFEKSAYAGGLGIWDIFQQAFSDQKYELLTIPIQNLGNLFIPNILSQYLDKFLVKYFHILFPTEFSAGSFSSGIFVVVLYIFLASKFLNKKRAYVKLLSFSFIWAIANFIGFYARESTHTLWTTHRYLSYSFAGVAPFIVLSIFLISSFNTNSSKYFKLSLFAILITFSFLSIKHQYLFNTERNFFAKDFFYQFNQFLPNIPKGSIIYFDITNNPVIARRYGSFFGGMFSEGSNFAIYNEGINYMYDFLFTYDFNEIYKHIGENSGNLEKVFTFYYGDKGLEDTTRQVRAILSSPKSYEKDLSNITSSNPYTIIENQLRSESDVISLKDENHYKETVIKILPKKETSSTVPSVISFYLKISPLIPKFPYIEGKKDDQRQRSDILSYLESQEEYRKNAIATSASYWKEQEPKLALDGRLETSWRGHRGYWDELDRGHIQEPEFLQIDLGKLKKVSKILWVSAQKPLIPTFYKIYSSSDGKEWYFLKEVKDNTLLQTGTEIKIDFNTVEARYLKMEIIKTYGNDGPELKEIEIIEDKHKHLDQNEILRVKSNPFKDIKSTEEFNRALYYTKQVGKIKLFWKSNAELSLEPQNFGELPIILDGGFHYYEFKLPATGTYWEQFQIEGIYFPALVELKEVKLNYVQNVED